jgi:hypothetical protein
VIIQGQADDIEALDFANISLTSAPVFGVAPILPGWYGCPLDPKNDWNAISLTGPAVLTLSNATIQCMAIGGISMDQSSFGLASGPTVSVDHTVIQNTDEGIWSAAGNATVSNTMIRFNVFGVDQVGGNIDLSGGGLGGNTVVCSSSAEWGPASVGSPPGIDVWNQSTADLNANDVTWDTPGPDYFSEYVNLPTDVYTCRSSACSVDAGSDDMNAVASQWPDAGISTTGNLLWDGGCG